MSKIKSGKYSAVYFEKTCKILEKYRPNDVITVQFFQRNNNVVLAGVNECLELLKNESQNYQNLIIYSLKDGDIIQENEPVLKIIGHYPDFGYLEGIIDGILTRQSSIATNCARVIKAANGKDVIYMNDRNDYWYNQENDGYAAVLGGITNLVTPAMLAKVPSNIKLVGTVPHALIQAFDGNLVAALHAYRETFPNDKLVALVDYHNDVINESLKVAKVFPDLDAVRVDTSKSLIDKYFLGKEEKYQGFDIHGVNKYLIIALRKALNDAGYSKVKIIVSSGFNEQIIEEFEQENVPVDIYGVGQSLGRINLNFTGDAVRLNDKQQAKDGRSELESTRLKKILL